MLIAVIFKVLGSYRRYQDTGSILALFHKLWFGTLVMLSASSDALAASETASKLQGSLYRTSEAHRLYIHTHTHTHKHTVC